MLEFYREGCSGGGYYELTVKLMDSTGKVLTTFTQITSIMLLFLRLSELLQTIKSYSSGKKGNLYNGGKWEEAGATFSDYGEGLRIIGFESYGELGADVTS